MSLGIKCPGCGSIVSRTIETRPTAEGRRRRRVCHLCGVRYSTLEAVHVFDHTTKSPYKSKEEPVDDDLSPG